MIADTIRALCGLSILCGVALTLAPEGSGKRMLSFACSVALLACVLEGLQKLDLTEYAVERSLYRQREQRFLEQSEEISRELDRRVIESRCQAYILDKARELGLSLAAAQVSVQWSPEGVWVPYAVMLDGEADAAERRKLAEKIETELGIPRERQEWKTDA